MPKWDPTTYERHRAQRERPATDLLAMLRPAPGCDVVDLGCGTGRITRRLHERMDAATTVGIDSSPTMLEEARAHAGDGVSFEAGDIRSFDRRVDVVFSNAALQWVRGQAEVLTRLCGLVRPGGQLAIQVPANFSHPSHVVADELGQEMGLPPQRRAIEALDPAAYAEILHAAGLVDHEVVLRIYGNPMPRTDAVIDWVSGTLLTSYREQLGDRFDEFVDEYRHRLLDRLGDPSGARPYFYAFPRILAWGVAPS